MLQTLVQKLEGHDPIVAWALEQPTTRKSFRDVLTVIALAYDHEKGSCELSSGLIAHITKYGAGEVWRASKHFEALGILTREPVKSPKGDVLRMRYRLPAWEARNEF